MDEVNIYTYTSIQGPKKRSGVGIYILETMTSKGEATFTKMITLEEMTEHQAELTVMLSAFSKLKKKCKICIFTEQKYMAAVIKNGWLERWEKNNWLNAKKKPVANVQEWQKMLKILNENVCEIQEVKTHKYLNWMKNETKKNEKEKENA